LYTEKKIGGKILHCVFFGVFSKKIKKYQKVENVEKNILPSFFFLKKTPKIAQCIIFAPIFFSV
jgi:hypothetical protein